MTPKYAAAALSALIAYFAYHAFAGEQGLGRWSDLQEELAAKQAQLEAIQAANDALRRDITEFLYYGDAVAPMYRAWFDQMAAQ